MFAFFSTVRRLVSSALKKSAAVRAAHRLQRAVRPFVCEAFEPRTLLSLSGFVINDINFNGQKDPGEIGVDGVPIYVDGVLAAYTSCGGSYNVTVPGDDFCHTIALGDTPGWSQTSGGSCGVYGNDLSGINFGLTGLGSAVGSVTDSDGNPLTGVQLYLDANNNGQPDTDEPSITSDSGSFNLQGLPPTNGQPLRIVLPTGYTQLSPIADGSIILNLADTLNTDGLSFVIAPSATSGSASGLVFGDVNETGSREPDESGMAGIDVFIDSNADGLPSDGEPQTTTDATGYWYLGGLALGTYDVTTVVPTGYHASTPNPVPVWISAGAPDYITDGTGLTADPSSPPTAAIVGTISHDINANGIQDNGEEGLSGWMAYCDINYNGQMDAGEPAATSDSSGYYMITDVSPGETYLVRVGEVAGWTASNADAIGGAYVSLPEDAPVVSQVDFTMRQGIISGSVLLGPDGGMMTWPDMNVFVDANGNHVLDAGEVCSLADPSNGQFTLNDVPAADSTAVMAVASGYRTPSPVLVNVLAAAALRAWPRITCTTFTDHFRGLIV